MDNTGRSSLDLFASSGTYYLRILESLASEQGAPQTLRNDWEAICRWVGSRDVLSLANEQRINAAWQAYLAVGLAPSVNLQPAFDYAHGKWGKTNSSDKPPTYVMDAFDRMLATDKEIAHKRALDVKAEGEKFAGIMHRNQGWWRSKPKAFRAWLFICPVWAVFWFFSIRLFDPFDWGGFYAEEARRTAGIMLIPFFAGIVYWAYRKVTQ
ncbi:hypothetical protein [Pseudomonas baltica]|uniref:hypothetical protein n=1 Tax=Pseudomonas baltica TaxID=2762576 RepID=UPI00289F9374|nr:hypothetical protein [Pseudomonas baltica]